MAMCQLIEEWSFLFERRARADITSLVSSNSDG